VGLIFGFKPGGENQNLWRQFLLAVPGALSVLHFLVIFDFETKLFV